MTSLLRFLYTDVKNLNVSAESVKNTNKNNPAEGCRIVFFIKDKIIDNRSA